MKKILSVLALLIFYFDSHSQLVINEYSCSNTNTVTDSYGQYEDWVELYNNGASAVNITGYYLSDDPAVPLKWQVPATTPINANSKRMVFCSDRGVVAANGALHPSFKLTQARYNGEWFLLSDATGTLVDSVHLNRTQNGHSRGRTTDGAATFSVFTTPTPNASNATATPYTAYATKPSMNVNAGFYASAQNIVLSSPDPGVTIRYTTDGSAPTATSTAYTSAINVSTTTVIRARAYSSNPNIAPSFTENNTYLINVSTTMNVISVAGPFTTTLFSWGSQPIFCSYEFFDKNKNFVEEFEGRAKRHGHDSWAYPQKGFKVYAQDELGYKAKMEHKYFPTSLRDTFDMFILKAGASDNYPGGPTKSCHLRDMFAHTLAEKYNLEMDLRKYDPTIVFVNGQYWGVYEIRERVDKDYFEYYYGKKEKNVDNLRYWGGMIVGPGTATRWNWLTNFIDNNSMTIPANYQTVNDSLNLKSFIQYFIFNQYLVNTDWLNWNTHWWGARSNNGNNIKWRYALWDEDNILDLGQNYTGVGNTTYNNDPCDPFDLFQSSSSIKHTQMLTKLLLNDDFKALYEQQWLEMLTGPLECTNILAHFDSVTAIIQPEMQDQINRWGGTYADWQSNIQYMRNQIANRCQIITSKLDTCMEFKPAWLKLNVSPANAGYITFEGASTGPYVWQKLIKSDSIYTLKAIPTAGPYWTFDHWEKQKAANTISPNTTTDLIQYNFNEEDSVIAFFKYFNNDSIDVTFDVNPAGTGTISLDGWTIPSYPYTIKLSRLNTYQLVSTPIVNHKFINWTKNSATTFFTPNADSSKVDFNYTEMDNIVANFEFVPPPPPPPPLPTLTPTTRNVNIPSAFSPNGDGKNDVFTIYAGKDVIGTDMTIFDRWGNELFHSKDKNKGWDGTYKNRAVEMGTYQYFIRVKYRDNTIEDFKGDVTVIR
ncbi:MAG: CotH kinase family protein [Chitinophagaceae bacterium]